MAKFVQEGKALAFTAPTGGVLNGHIYVIGSLPVLADHDADEGEMFTGHTVGVWEMPKTAANTPAEGAKAYWDATAKSVTTTATANTLIGAFTEGYTAGTTSASVRLSGALV
ncbi:protein of unknown function DUF2190 [Vibrio phage 2.096.O._10N.286.48.B5]|nr:protein of unknown function DUF2190 [Vibrio phage 2.096.O._10N.286.48.B5]